MPGVPNFHKVDDHLYRGGQPTPLGIRNLAQHGIRTVVDLRGRNAQAEREQREVEKAGMHYVHIPMSTTAQPTDRQISDALSVLNDRAAWPVFVHCAGGRDRTGAVVACYRISRYKWSNAEALAEARRAGLSKANDRVYIQSWHPQAAENAASPKSDGGAR